MLDKFTKALMALRSGTSEGRKAADVREATKRLILYYEDVQGAALSFRLFRSAKAEVYRLDLGFGSAMRHHAICFITAARRVGRLLESLARNRAFFSATVGVVIKQEWKKNRAFYISLIKARDAIEHIDGEVNDSTKWAFYLMDGDRFEVTKGKSVEVNEASLGKVVSPLEAILDAIIREAPPEVATIFDAIEWAESQRITTPRSPP